MAMNTMRFNFAKMSGPDLNSQSMAENEAQVNRVVEPAKDETDSEQDSDEACDVVGDSLLPSAHMTSLISRQKREPFAKSPDQAFCA